MTFLDIEVFVKDWDLLKIIDKVVIIGRGRDASKYKYVSRIPVFAINSALEFYPTANMVVMVQAHYKELKDLPLFSESTILHINRKYQVTNGLIPGCTPSLFLSFLIKEMKNGSTIYLQGFSMDETENTKYPTNISKNKKYDWARQIQAFQKCKARAVEKNIKLILIDDNPRLPFITKGVPQQEDLISG